MATTPLAVIPSTAIDTAGISAATAPPSSSDPRLGTAYNTTLAAATPIWFHPMKDGSQLMVNSRSWSAATQAGATPGIYSSYTETTLPTWALIKGGASVPVPGAITFKTPGVSAPRVTGACSRAPGLLWLLHTATQGGDRVALMQHWDVNPNGSLGLTGEELLPATATVTFDKGIEYATPFLNVYGTDSAGTLYRIRKGWGRVGFNQTNPTARLTARGQVWEYYTGIGWSQDPADLAPIQAGLTSMGPVSFGYYRNQIVAATVTKTGTVYGSQFWVQKSGMSWTPVGSSIPLGDSSDGSYLGGGVQLLSQLGAVPATLGAGVSAGVVYVSAQKTSASGHDALVNSWAIYPISV